MADIKQFLKKHEGFSATPYEDERGFKTVGFGANLDAPSTLNTMQRIGLEEVNDEESADQLMTAQLAEKEEELRRRIPNYDQLDPGQQTALKSLMYNNPVLVGRNLTKAVTEGDRTAAAREILLNSNAGESGGLARRRIDEAKTFNNGKLPDLTPEEAEKLRAQLAKIKNANTRAAAEAELASVATPEDQPAFRGVPYSLQPPTEPAPKPTMNDMRKVADQSMARMQQVKNRKTDAERQKGLNAIPMSPAISPYPGNDKWNPDLMDTIKTMGMMNQIEFPTPEVEEGPAQAMLPNLDTMPPLENIDAQEVALDQEVEDAARDMGVDPAEMNRLDFMDRLTGAQQARRRDQMLDALLRAGSSMGAAIAGQGHIRPDFTAIDAFKPMIGAELEDLKEEASMTRVSQQLADAEKVRDKNSEISQMSRDAVASYLGRMGDEKTAKRVLDGKMSHNDLENLFGKINLSNMLTQFEAAQTRIEVAKLKAEEEKKKNEDRKSEKDSKIRQTFRKAIDDYNKETRMIDGLVTYKTIKDTLDKKQFSGIDDIKTLYSMIKALDPESVVRESEVELMKMGESGFARIRNMPRRFFKGDIFSDDYRKKLISRMGKMVNDNVSKFRIRSKGLFDEMRREGYEPEDFLSEELPLSDITGKPADKQLAFDPKAVDQDALAKEIERRKLKK